MNKKTVGRHYRNGYIEKIYGAFGGTRNGD
jgi:hypothetical protein